MKYTQEDLDFVHAEVYDAAKAHAYYERTKHLKGRKKGSAAYVSKPRPRKAPVKTAAQRRKEVEVKVAALKKRLEKLKKYLRTLVDAAKKRSGQEPKSGNSHENASSKTGSGGKERLTPQQKREAAKRAKENYEKNKDKKNQTPEQELKDLQDEIKQIKAKIKAAIADARKKSTNNAKSQTALKGR